MAKKHRQFKSQGKKGKGIDLLLVWLVIIQLFLLIWKIAYPDAMSWWVALVPAYIIAIPFLLIFYGLFAAARK